MIEDREERQLVLLVEKTRGPLGRWSLFMSGWLACCAARSLWQDWLGQDAYVMHVREHWVSASLTVPVAFLLLVFALWVYLKEARS